MHSREGGGQIFMNSVRSVPLDDDIDNDIDNDIDSLQGSCADDSVSCHAGDDWRPPGPIRGHRGGCQDAERQQLVGAICLRSLEGPRASNATDQSVPGRNR